jgi:hypothetical protein
VGRLSKIAACAALLTSLLVACTGANGGTSAEQTGRPVAAWAKDICATMQSFESTREVRARQAQNRFAAATNAKEVRASIAQFFGDLAILAEQARDEARAAGQPAVENGQEVSAALSKALEDMQAVYTDNSRAVGKLAVEDDAQFQEQVTLLAQGAQERVQSINETLKHRLTANPSEAVSDAMRDEPACDFLTQEAG